MDSCAAITLAKVLGILVFGLLLAEFIYQLLVYSSDNYSQSDAQNKTREDFIGY